MPGGIRLKIKPTKQEILRKVKNSVDENQGSGVGSYDVSMIYPKRIFTEQGPSSGQWNRPGTETVSVRCPLPGNRSEQADCENSGNTLRRSRPFGANVHTLGSDDQGPFDDRNIFWNGNSTGFGGNDRN